MDEIEPSGERALDTAAPAIELRRLRTVKTVEVLVEDLERFGKAHSDEGESFSLFTLALGVLIPGVVQYAAPAIVGHVLAVAAIAATCFGLRWWRARSARPTLVDLVEGKLRKPSG